MAAAFDAMPCCCCALMPLYRYAASRRAMMPLLRHAEARRLRLAALRHILITAMPVRFSLMPCCCLFDAAAIRHFAALYAARLFSLELFMLLPLMLLPPCRVMPLDAISLRCCYAATIFAERCLLMPCRCLFFASHGDAAAAAAPYAAVRCARQR